MCFKFINFTFVRAYFYDKSILLIDEYTITFVHLFGIMICLLSSVGTICVLLNLYFYVHYHYCLLHLLTNESCCFPTEMVYIIIII